MAKYKRQKVKRYHRSFYSRGARIKRGVGILVLVLVLLKTFFVDLDLIAYRYSFLLQI